MKRILLIVMSLLGVCAYSLYHGNEDGKGSHAATKPRPAGTSTSAGAATTSVRATSTSKCCIIAPDSPLPAPAAVSSGPEEERAILLAQQVLAGGEGTLPALVAALQQAGFPIRDARGKLVVQPVGKSQGIVFEQWEVNALAAMFANRRHVTVPLNNFAEVIASPLPELRDAPMADFLLEGIRAHARDKDGSMLFWAVFIAELGRQNQVHKSYDILFDIDPAEAQLDTLQLALICKRLAADLAVLAKPDNAGKKQGFNLLEWLEPKVYASELPCTLSNREAEILDWTATVSGFGFDLLLGHLGDKGLRGAEGYSQVAGLINIALAYAKLAITQATFDIKFEMQGGTPLVRTKDHWPATGGKKTIVATLRMDTGNLQFANCFRIMLNAAGLDFDLENDGPIEGASVAWSGQSGFGGELVQFVADTSSRFQTGGGTTSPILDARTDKSGRASVDVEGVGQREDLGDDPRPVMKEASVIATAALKPANMYRDLKDAISTAQSGLPGLWTVPAELLYRTNFSFGGSYAFPVQDWEPRTATWAGTITRTMRKRQIVVQNHDSICCGGRPITSRQSDRVLETVEQRWEINAENAKALTPEFTMAKASYSAKAGVSSKIIYKRTGWNSCKTYREPTWSKHMVTENASASYSGKAEVGIKLGADGSYSIGPAPPDGSAVGERKTTGVLDYGPACGASTPSQKSEKTTSYSPPLPASMINGKIDPDNSNELYGATIEVEKDPSVGIVVTYTSTWYLSRRK